MSMFSETHFYVQGKSIVHSYTKIEKKTLQMSVSVRKMYIAIACGQFVKTIFSIIDLCSHSLFHGLEIMTFQITAHLLNCIILYTHTRLEAGK